MSVATKITKIENKIESQVLVSGHSLLSMFMTCCYTRRIDGTLLNKNFPVTSEATDILEFQHSHALI